MTDNMQENDGVREARAAEGESEAMSSSGQGQWQERDHMKDQMREQDPFAGIPQKALRAMPFYVLVPVLFWGAFRLSGYGLDWRGFGLGALGWFIALFLRGPLSALVRRWPKEKAQTIIVGSSGVLEEGVRLILLAATSASFAWAQSVGQGWAAIEVVFTMVNAVVILSLIKRTDEKAVQAKALLMDQGNIQGSPAWGVLERIWASAYHIGATLIIAHTPWLVLLLIPLHSGLNFTALRAAKRSVIRANLYIAAFGLITLAGGLLLFQH